MEGSSACLLFLLLGAVGETPVVSEIACEGRYTHHLQGVAGDGQSCLFWSFTTELVKTDLQGNVLCSVKVPFHHGDLCFEDNKVYVAYSDFFNKPGADSKLYVYDGKDLSLLFVEELPEVTFGAGGMDRHKGHLFVIGGLPHEKEQNYVYEYDEEFRHVKTHIVESGHTHLGIQTACHHQGQWWFGCYTMNKKKGLIRTDEFFEVLGIYDVSPSIGLVGWGEGRFLMAKHFGEAWQAKLLWMAPDEKEGLVPWKRDRPATDHQQP